MILIYYPHILALPHSIVFYCKSSMNMFFCCCWELVCRSFLLSNNGSIIEKWSIMSSLAAGSQQSLLNESFIILLRETVCFNYCSTSGQSASTHRPCDIYDAWLSSRPQKTASLSALDAIIKYYTLKKIKIVVGTIVTYTFHKQLQRNSK